MKPYYEDNHILVLEKPAGIATQPEFEEMAKQWLKKTANKPGNVFLQPVHRLDKPVSGLILFAKTSKAVSRLNQSLREKKFQKFYVAWVEGITEPEGTLEHHLSHGEFRAYQDANGKKAILHFKRLKTENGCSLVEILLITGRYHQIRAQFFLIGHPICGDQKYGATIKRKTLALHHQKLIFPHPTKQEEITVHTPSSFSF